METSIPKELETATQQLENVSSVSIILTDSGVKNASQDTMEML
jgi:hypothetical protein